MQNPAMTPDEVTKRGEIISAISLELEKSGRFDDGVKSLVWAARIYDHVLAPSPPVAPQDVPEDVALKAVGLVRVCPGRDGRCPHGLSCPFVIDRYRCDMEGSRKARPAAPTGDRK